MVIAGVLGLGLIPFALAEPIGKEVARLLGKLPEVTKKEKKGQASGPQRGGRRGCCTFAASEAAAAL